MQFSIWNGHREIVALFAPLRPKIEIYNQNLHCHSSQCYYYCHRSIRMFIILPMFATGSSKLTISNEVPFKNNRKHRTVASEWKKNITNNSTRLSKNTKYENQCSATVFTVFTVTYKHKERTIHTHIYSCVRVYIRTFTSIWTTRTGRLW